jgi:REP-associated tyrosine transposase
VPHTFVSSLFHVVFSTKDRRVSITEDFRDRLWAYMGGIAHKNGMKAIAVGGTADHAHLLLSIPATMPLAKAVQLIKGGSSKWVHDTFQNHPLFSWQKSYGAFSISISHTTETIAYIRNQGHHHRRRSFQDEFLAFLKKNKIDFDERFLWG